MTAGRPRARGAGFTLVEFVVTLLILGILAAIAAPRFQDASAFTQRGFADQVIAALRYAQKIAIAKRREVCVDFLPASGSLPDRIALTLNPTTTSGAPCSAQVNLPGEAAAYVVGAPSGIGLLLSTNFRFDGLGAPTPAPVTVTLTGRGVPITISAQTGHVSD